MEAEEGWRNPLHRRALAGDAAAQHDLGWLFESGDENYDGDSDGEEDEGVDNDQVFHHDVDERERFCNFAEAAKWYRLAATGGDVRAQKRLAIWEKHSGTAENNSAVPVRHEEAYERYLRAAKKGDAFARCNVARYHALGIGDYYDMQRALKCFRMAAEQGDAEAQFELGNCYANRKGVKQDIDKAVHWYRLVANQGHAAAQYQLACTLEYTDADDRDDDMAEIAELYRAAAEQGHAEAQCEFGNCLFNGVGVERNIEQAIAWYRRAADQFHAAAHHNLALCYEAGEGVDQDREKAAEHYCMAAEEADGVAERRLLTMKLSEKTEDEAAAMDTDDHASDALDFLRNRAAAGDHNAQHDLGRKFELGIDVECDFEEAHRWYRLSADHGNQFATKRLAIWQSPGDDGILHLPTDHAAAFVLYQQAATQHSDAQAQFDLGMYFYLGKGTEQNHAEAAKHFRLAADQGHVDAQVQLALCYEGGEGVEEDIQEAIKWYRMAAEQSDAFAQSHLASLYETGISVQKDVTEAFKLYRTAGEQGDPNHQIQLAESYFYGVGTEASWQEAKKWYATAEQAHKSSGSFKRRVASSLEGKDDAESLRWYRAAAEQGDLIAQSRLAHLLHKGEGSEKNMDEAVKWYRIAAQAGDLESAKALANIYEAGDGVEKDLQQACKFRTLAAEMFIDVEEAFSVAEFLEGNNNDGDERILSDAFRWYQVAAAIKDHNGITKVAEFYELGKGGVEKNIEEALKRYMESEAYKKVAELLTDSNNQNPALVKAVFGFNHDLPGAFLHLAQRAHGDPDLKRFCLRKAFEHGYPPEKREPEIGCIHMSKCDDKVALKDRSSVFKLINTDGELEMTHGSTSSFAFLPSGGRVVLVTDEGLIVRPLLQQPGVNNDNRIGLERQNDKVKLIAWSTSDVIATTSDNSNQISLWQTDGKRFRTLHGHSDNVLSIDISPNGWHLASCSCDNTIRIWDIASGICLQVFQVQDQNDIAVAFSPNGAMLATNSRDGKVVIRDTDDWTELLTLGDHRKYVSLDWSANSQFLVTADRERMRVFSFTGANLGECVLEEKGWQNAAVFSGLENQILFAAMGKLELQKMDVPFDIIADEELQPVEKLPLPSSSAPTNDFEEQLDRLAVLVERIDHPHALHQLIRLLSAINTSDLNPLAALAHLRAEIDVSLGNQTFEQVEAMITEYENGRQSIAALSPVQPISVLTMNLDASVEPQLLSFQEIHAIFSFVRTQCWMVPRLEGDLLEATKTFSDALDKTDRHAADLAEQVAKHLDAVSSFAVHLSQSSDHLFVIVDQIKSILEVVHEKTDSLAKSQMDLAPLFADLASSSLFADLSSSFAPLPHESPAKSGHRNAPVTASQIENSASSNVLEGDNNDMEIDAKVSNAASNPASQEVTELKIVREYREAGTSIHHIAFSPDGKLFAASYHSGLFLFDAETDTEIWHLDAGSLISAFSPDGSSIIVAHYADERQRKYELKVYNSHTGELKVAFRGSFSTIDSLLWSKTDIILSCCFRTGERYHATRVKLWRPDGTCHPALSEHLAELSEPVAFSPKGDKLFSFVGGKLRMWNVASGACLHESTLPCVEAVFSPNGKMLALRLHDGKVCILDAITWELRHQIDMQKLHGCCNRIIWSPSSEFLAASSQYESRLISIVRVSDLKTHFFSHPKTIRSMQFAPNGEELLVGCEDTRLRRLRLPFTTAVDSSSDIDFPSFGQLSILHSSSSSIVGTAEAKLKLLQVSLRSHSHSGIDNIQRLVRLLRAMKATGFKSAAQIMAAAGHIDSGLQKTNSIIDIIIHHQQSNHDSMDQLQQACKYLREILSQLVEPVKQLNLHTSYLRQMQQLINGKDASVTPRELTADELREIFTFAWNHGQQLQMQMSLTINAGEEMAKAVIAYDESAAVVREEVENNLAKLKGYLAHVNRCVAEPDMTATFRNALRQIHQSLIPTASSIEAEQEAKRRRLVVDDRQHL